MKGIRQFQTVKFAPRSWIKKLEADFQSPKNANTICYLTPILMSM